VKVLICGDSFTSDWQIKYPNQTGWVNMLAKKYKVTNLAQSAVGEYKILKQIQSADLNQFDSVIVSHTSPNRIYCTKHPIHYRDPLYKSADLIYTDMLDHSANTDCQLALGFFERYFDLDQAEEINNLICMEILNILGQYDHLNQLHLVNYITKNHYPNLPCYDLYPLFKKYRGNMNHFDEKGNRIMFDYVDTWLQENK
jgi:hypothetical protein